MSYFLCAAGSRLRTQIDRKFPNRDKRSDGWIGDTSHQAVPSDHNPDWSDGGVVRAIDIDADLSKKDPNVAEKLANQLKRAAKYGEKRISYVIFNRKIASSRENWAWRTYTGSNTHEHHIHVSFTPAGDRDGKPFDLAVLERD